MVLVLVAWVGRAEAIERNCPAGQTWSPSQGACVKKAVVRKRSPAEAYYLAIDTLEGKGGARKAIVLTGAMRPSEMRRTDATQNVTEALVAVQLLAPGVYVAMHNRVLQFPGVIKDPKLGTFVRAGG